MAWWYFYDIFNPVETQSGVLNKMFQFSLHWVCMENIGGNQATNGTFVGVMQSKLLKRYSNHLVDSCFRLVFLKPNRPTKHDGVLRVVFLPRTSPKRHHHIGPQAVVQHFLEYRGLGLDSQTINPPPSSIGKWNEIKASFGKNELIPVVTISSWEVDPTSDQFKINQIK